MSWWKKGGKGWYQEKRRNWYGEYVAGWRLEFQKMIPVYKDGVDGKPDLELRTEFQM